MKTPLNFLTSTRTDNTAVVEYRIYRGTRLPPVATFGQQGSCNDERTKTAKLLILRSTGKLKKKKSMYVCTKYDISWDTTMVLSSVRGMKKQEYDNARTER